jgi:hypothetical protein
MTKPEAHIILNQVREGVLHPQSTIIKALTITGDIHVCLDNHLSTGCCPSHNPPVPDVVVQSLEGEPQ